MSFKNTLHALCFLAALPATAQETAVSRPQPGPEQQTDIVDLRRRLFGNSAPRTDSGQSQFSLIPGVGFAPASGLSFSLTAVSTFRPKGGTGTEKLSNIIGSASASVKGQIVLQGNAVVFSRGDRRHFLAEWRYMRYPSPTWGLGPASEEAAQYKVDFDYLKLHQAYLWRVGRNLYAGPGLFGDLLWRISEQLPAGQGTDFKSYGIRHQERALGPALRVLYDSRVNAVNPGGGTYASLALRSVLEELGSTNSWQSAQIDLRHYLPVGRRGNVLAFWNYDWLTLGGNRPPYLLLPSTGWDDNYNTGRGYQQGRYRGRNLLYLESEFRFGLTRNGLLGAVAFANAQAFPDDPLKGIGRVLPGAGAGLRVKLNKYSGTNLAFDYGFGAGGSQFLALNVGEVF
ncbi:MAG: hypothetical protein EOO16_11430 [Chitinophagaceae bacterium]|nr:MAG: hypothetical protein EOO16_11430 [Chitinophagaceae bacterium]